jgi:drug/metabolite transporter (DMT)-like permease
LADRPQLVSFAPGLIWGCWLLVLSGFGGLITVEVPNGLHVTVWAAAGGLAVLAVAMARRWREIAWRPVFRAYAPVGTLELAQNGAFLAGAWLLLETFPLAIPLIRLHASYLILVIGTLARKAGWADGERVTRRKLTCAAVTVVGLTLLSLDKLDQGVAFDEGLGVALLIVSALLSSVQHFVQAHRSVAAGPGSELPGTMVQLGVVVALGLPLLLTTGEATPPLATLLYLVAVGTVMSGLAFLLRFVSYTRARLSSFGMAIRQELEYALQAITAVVVLGATLGLLTAIGSVLVLSAAVAVVGPSRSSPPRLDGQAEVRSELAPAGSARNGQHE